jgi:hypothetical protein
MRQLSKEQFLRLISQTASTFKTATARGEVALAFGAPRPLAGGVYCDLDLVAMLLTTELASIATRKGAAAILRTFADKWTEGVARAERTTEPVFVVALEAGTQITHARRVIREGVNLTVATLPEFASFDAQKARTVPNRLTLINLTAVIADARARAAKLDIEFPRPMVTLDDPGFVEARRVIHEARERLPRIGA